MSYLRAIHYNETLYPNPETFDPARFLNHTLPAADYINSNNPNERDHFTYGAGRRICPGIHVAEKSLYINIVRTLWGFNITKMVGTDGKVQEPTTAMVRGFLSVPEDFKANFKARSPQHEKIIREEFAQAEIDGIVFS